MLKTVQRAGDTKKSQKKFLRSRSSGSNGEEKHTDK